MPAMNLRSLLKINAQVRISGLNHPQLARLRPREATQLPKRDALR
jgi:hypothetical protein